MQKGYVYVFKLIERNNIYKIGSTYNDVNVRLKQVELEKGYKMEVFHIIESNDHKETEKLFHLFFANQHVEDELFELSEEDCQWIKKWDYPQDIMNSIFGKEMVDKDFQEDDLLNLKQVTEILLKEEIVKSIQGTRRYVQSGSLPSIQPPFNRPQVGHRVRKSDLDLFITYAKMDRLTLMKELLELRRKKRDLKSEINSMEV